MKPNNFFVVVAELCFLPLFLVCLSCSKDDTTSTSSSSRSTGGGGGGGAPFQDSCDSCQLLYYGGDHHDAPTLESGSYEAAARYTPAKIGNLAGKTIREIHYY